MSIRTLTVERSTSTAHRLMYYDGVCGNVHGHNMDWEIKLTIDMEYADEDNMPLDFKLVSDRIDSLDHAIILNEEDPLINAPSGVRDLLGEVVTVEGDPTCEKLSLWMAKRMTKIPAVLAANVIVHETDKYGMEANKHG